MVCLKGFYICDDTNVKRLFKKTVFPGSLKLYFCSSLCQAQLMFFKFVNLYFVIEVPVMNFATEKKTM